MDEGISSPDAAQLQDDTQRTANLTQSDELIRSGATGKNALKSSLSVDFDKYRRMLCEKTFRGAFRCIF